MIQKLTGRLGVKTPLGNSLLLAGFEGVERLSGLFAFQAELVAADEAAAQVAPPRMIGKPVTIELALETVDAGRVAGGQKRFLNGLVSRFAHLGKDRRGHSYQVELVPWLWLLTQTADCRVFQNLSALDIVKRVLDEARQRHPGVVDYRDATKGSYTKKDYCIQYRETDFNFVSRLMEQDGIHYFFEHREDGHTLVLADSPAAHQPLSVESKLKFRPGAGTGEEDAVVTSWQEDQALKPGLYTLRDYHFQLPHATLEASAPTITLVGDNDKLEVYDYPGEFAERFNDADKRLGDVSREGERFAKLRMEEIESSRLEIRGISPWGEFSAGRKFELTEHPDEAQNRSYVVTSVHHAATQPRAFSAGGDGDELAYTNRFTCIPDTVRFRPVRVTARPAIQGMQVAVVVGTEGTEIDTDKYGRVQVKFPWDREPDKKSCWLRVSQPWAGQQWGAFFWPRVGHEVLVAFLEGDPDCPVIVGSLYGARNMPPYELPANQTRSGIKTRSTANGGPQNFNEIRFEDRKGKEELYIHAERRLCTVVEAGETRSVGGSRKTTVSKDEQLFVKKGDRFTNIENGFDSLLMDRGFREARLIEGDDVLTLDAGSVTHTALAGKYSVSAKEGLVSALDKLILTVGLSSITLEPSKITIVVGGSSITLDATTIKSVAPALHDIRGLPVKINS